jgi:hypothetical protein
MVAMDLVRLSRIAIPAALLVLLGAANCASLPRPGTPGAQAQATRQFADEAARWVRRCYRAPRVASVGRAIVTQIRARYASDGSLIGMPVVVSQSGVTPRNSAYAGIMADAARRAVIGCAPIRVPPAFTRRPWHELDLTFSPRRMV